MSGLWSILQKKRPIRVAYVSSYIPRHCGIATYTKDLTNAVNLLNPHELARIVAIHDPHDGELSYPWEVQWKITDTDDEQYRVIAQQINDSDIDVVSLQLEFGLYGGPGGAHILAFTNALKKPLVTTFHTVVTDTTSEYATVLRTVAKRSAKIIVMMEYGKEQLRRLYDIPNKKITVIPHGVPDIVFNSGEKLKRKKRLQNRVVIGNINLLSPNKGIEYALEAVAAVAKSHPEILYLVIGRTHPKLVRTEGEQYRRHLMRTVKKLGIQENVRFINSYLELHDLIEWLRVFDFYITPYLDPAQVTSGALAYAIGAGKLCISTPYIYAKEVLEDNRGVIVPFKDSDAIAQAILSLLNDPDKKKEMEQKAYKFGRLMTWPNIAQHYLEIFRKVS